jgi:hypothetical protein
MPDGQGGSIERKTQRMSHDEKYKVTKADPTSTELTLTVDPISVPDTPVKSIVIRNHLPTGCNSLEGAENPVDVKAIIYANGDDFKRAVDTIKANKHSFRYTSTPGAASGSEGISKVGWARL